MAETPEDKTKSTAIAIAAGPRGLQLNSLDDMWRFAKAVALSGMAPRGLEKPEALVTAMQLGAELGMGPMTAIQNIAVINGRPTVWGDVMLGLCMSSGLFDEEAFYEQMDGVPDSDDYAGVCTCRRLGAKSITHSFSVRNAKRAGLWDRRTSTGKPTPWQQYPQRMLQMRARSWALRDCFPDVLKGIYAGEEARDIVVDAVPSEEHLAQAREAREAEAEASRLELLVADAAQAREAREAEAKAIEAAEPGKVAEVLAREAREAETDPDFGTVENREAAYNEYIEAATYERVLVGLQERIDADSVLAEEAAIRLTDKISARKMAIREEGESPGRPTLDLAKAIIAVGSAPEPEDAPLTSDGEEAGYQEAIGVASSYNQLNATQDRIDADGVLTDEAKKRLTGRVAGRKAVVRASRGTRSNEPKTD